MDVAHSQPLLTLADRDLTAWLAFSRAKKESSSRIRTSSERTGRHNDEEESESDAARDREGKAEKRCRGARSPSGTSIHTPLFLSMLSQKVSPLCNPKLSHPSRAVRKRARACRHPLFCSLTPVFILSLHTSPPSPQQDRASVRLGG